MECWKSALEKLGLGTVSSVSKNFWIGKRVLVTGHTGFKGSWLCLWLQIMNAKVYGLALQPTTKPTLFNEAFIGDGMKSMIGDIRDYKTVYQALKQSKPEIIVHMAAQPLVLYSYRQPVETYSTNIMGTVHVLEAAIKVGTVKAVVNVTTDKCYENNEKIIGYREDEVMGGYDPYSSSKACSELVTRAYRSSFFKNAGVGLASARAGNVIGGGDWAADRLIPDILAAFQYAKPAIIRNPNAIRPWQHVLEPLSGYLMLAERLYKNKVQYSEAWNFGPNDSDAKSVLSIVEQMTASWGGKAKWKLDKKNYPHETNNLKLDISKAKAKLEWFPVWNLETAIESVIDWHKSWINKKENASEICKRQIIDYEFARSSHQKNTKSKN